MKPDIKKIIITNLPYGGHQGGAGGDMAITKIHPIKSKLKQALGMGSETDFCITRYADLIVRRLTPLECERLQGFPDFWTEQGGGRAISDTSRYQMLGNSIAVPCVAYIMQGIYHALERRD